MAEPNRPAPPNPRPKPPPRPADPNATVVGKLGKTAAGGIHDANATFVGDSDSVPAPVPPTPAPAESAFAGTAGERLGDYEIVKKLGQGGMGAVYLAREVSLDRKVALKTMTRELAAKADFVNRFLREARAMAKVTHPNVVQIYAANQINGQYFAAIEFIDGQSMQKWMDQKKQLSIGDALFVTIVCAEALKYAHDQSLIHRDIKPDNVLVNSRGVVKVADFGLAKATDEDVSMTQSGTGLGTPLYMAPEQARNAKHVDQRTDIYALGCMLYYFVTGKLPFMGTNTLELIMAKEQGRYAPPRKLNPNVPERLDLIIGKMIEKDPKNRYPTCAEVIRDLSSLGLANDSLSFIDAPDKATLGRSATTSAAPAAARSASAPRSSAQDAERSEPAADAAKTYIVQYTDKQGKNQIKKLTAAQVLQALRGGLIDSKAKAKTSVEAPYVPLAQIPEFSRVVERKAVAARADQNAASLKEQFAKIDKQYQRRGLVRWFQNLVSNVKGLISLAIYLAVLIGGIYAAFAYGLPFVKSKMKGDSTTAPAAAAGTTP